MTAIEPQSGAPIEVTTLDARTPKDGPSAADEQKVSVPNAQEETPFLSATTEQSEPVTPIVAPDPALAEMLSELAALREEFAAKLRYDTSKDRQIDLLHSELQEHKQDLYFKMMRPLFNDLIGLQDSLYGLLKFSPAPEPLSESESRVRKSVAAVADVIDSTLDRYGVTAFTEESEVFSSQRQRTERVVETDDPKRDRTIAERLRKGFIYNGRVLRPELVATFRLKR